LICFRKHIKGNVGGEDGWSKDIEKMHPGPEEDEAARPAASAACQRDRISNKGASDIEEADRGTAALQKLRPQGRVESPVTTRYLLDSHSE